MLCVVKGSSRHNDIILTLFFVVIQYIQSKTSGSWETISISFCVGIWNLTFSVLIKCHRMVNSEWWTIKHNNTHSKLEISKIFLKTLNIVRWSCTQMYSTWHSKLLILSNISLVHRALTYILVFIIVNWRIFFMSGVWSLKNGLCWRIRN